MFFLIIACLFFVVSVPLLICAISSKNRTSAIVGLFFCEFLAVFLLFTSATFPPTPTVDNIEFLAERTLDSDENNVLISSYGVSTTLNLYKFFEDFDFKRINSEQFRIVESANYDEITLQLYGYKNNFWYSNIFSQSYLYVLIIPAK